MKRIFLVLAVAAAGCAARALPDYGAVPDFRLTDQDGGAYGSADLKGSVWLADFIYTSCPGPCPALTAQMALLQKKLPESVRLVSVSVDPERDTPAVLKKYADKFGADARRWRFLTGGRKEVSSLVTGGFKLAAVPLAGGLVAHSTKIALVDRDLRLRGYYDGDDAASIRNLERDSRALAAR